MTSHSNAPKLPEWCLSSADDFEGAQYFRLRLLLCYFGFPTLESEGHTYPCLAKTDKVLKIPRSWSTRRTETHHVLMLTACVRSSVDVGQEVEFEKILEKRLENQ